MESTRNRLTTIKTWFCLTVGLSILLFFGGCAGPAYMTGAGNFHTVIVDAGHGGHDMGAKSVAGQPEKVLALDTARRLAIELRKQGSTSSRPGMPITLSRSADAPRFPTAKMTPSL